jgi:hypothetical protein
MCVCVCDENTIVYFQSPDIHPPVPTTCLGGGDFCMSVVPAIYIYIYRGRGRGLSLHLLHSPILFSSLLFSHFPLPPPLFPLPLFPLPLFPLPFFLFPFLSSLFPFPFPLSSRVFYSLFLSSLPCSSSFPISLFLFPFPLSNVSSSPHEEDTVHF